MIEVTPADIGRTVVYRDRATSRPEEGVITSFNRRWVFVRYGDEKTPKATNRRQLSWPVTTPRPEHSP